MNFAICEDMETIGGVVFEEFQGKFCWRPERRSYSLKITRKFTFCVLAVLHKTLIVKVIKRKTLTARAFFKIYFDNATNFNLAFPFDFISVVS